MIYYMSMHYDNVPLIFIIVTCIMIMIYMIMPYIMIKYFILL